jgi:hypothetical protein
LQFVGDIKDTGCLPDIFVQQEFVAVRVGNELCPRLNHCIGNKSGTMNA